MTVTLDLSEVHGLARDIHAGAGRVVTSLRAPLARGANKVQGLAQVNAPVDIGTLKNSISNDVDTLGFEVGPEVNYGGYVEEGTTGPYPIENAFGWGITVMHPGIEAQPYLGPAFDAHLPGIVDDIADAMERGVW